MQGLSKVIREKAEEFAPATNCKTDEGAEMERAAADWAAASLRLFQGKLLSRALRISAALVEFVAEYEKGIPNA